MARLRQLGLWCLLFAALAVLPTCAALAGEGAAPPPSKSEAKAAEHALTPAQQAAHDLLERFKIETEIKEGQRRFLATQHLAAGKDKLVMQDFRGALRDFQKAVEYEPNYTEAQQCLQKARSLLGLREGGPVDILGAAAAQEGVARDLRKMELLNLFAEGRALYEKGQYAEAIETFTRVVARARVLSPSLDVGKMAEEAELYARRAATAVQEQRQREQDERLKKAKEEADGLRKGRAKAADQRSEALYRQAVGLLEQRRFDEARKAADEILRHDPNHGGALALRETALATASSEAIDRALKARQVEVLRHWNSVAAMMTPQGSLVSMPPELFEIVRNRKAPVLYSGEPKPPAEWEAKAREALNKKVSFDFVETPLQDVVTFLSSLADTTIVLDPKALKEQNPQITLRVGDMRLEAALGWICRLAGLAYGLRNEAIFVSTPGGVREGPRLRMYDVSDLTLEIPNFKGNAKALATDTGFGPGQQEGGSMYRDFFTPDEEKDKEERLTGPKLIEFIRRIIAPGSWIEEEGEGLRGKDNASRPDDPERLSGQALVDVISITIGGHTWVAVREKE